MHALEDRHEFSGGENASDRDIVHLRLIFGLVPLEFLNNPKTTIALVFVVLLNELLSDCVVEVLGGFTGLLVGPVKDLLVDTLALGQLRVELVERSIGLSGSNVNRLTGLQLDAH